MRSIPLLAGVLALGLVIEAGAQPGHGYMLFAYRTEEASRLCRGNTTTGDAECVDGTSETATTIDGTNPRFRDVDGVTVRWLKYPNVEGPQAPGLYTFFVYYSKEGPRVCTGNTATSQAVCATGTATWAKTRGSAPPAYVTDTNRAITHLKYFEPRPGKAGDFAFAAYHSKGSARICVMAASTGETVCTTGSRTFSREKAATSPKWQDRRAQLQLLRYFRASR